MKKILLFSLTCLSLFGNVKPSIRNTEPIDEYNKPSLVAQNKGQTQEEVIEESYDDDIPQRDFNLNAVQESFFYSQHTPTSNTLNVDYRMGEIVPVRTRASMITNIVFENEIVSRFILGDEEAFQANILRTSPDSESNILLLKPVSEYIGVDSNLVIYTKSGKIFQFYIFSTDFTSPKNPSLLVAIKSENYGVPRTKPKPKWKKPATPKKAIAPAPKKTTAPQEQKTQPKEQKTAPKEQKATSAQPKTAPKEQKATPKEQKTAPAQSKVTPTQPKTAPKEQKTAPAQPKAIPPKEQKAQGGGNGFSIKMVEISKKPQSPLAEPKDKAEHNMEEKKKDYREISYKAVTKDDGNFIRIGDEVNYLWVDKRKVKGGYTQKPKKVNLKPTQGALAIVAKEIFDDGKFTYFKYDRENTGSNFPALYEVVDGYDSPVNFRVVGDYIIAENLSPKWTLRLGEEWVCVRKEVKKK